MPRTNFYIQFLILYDSFIISLYLFSGFNTFLLFHTFKYVFQLMFRGTRRFRDQAPRVPWWICACAGSAGLPTHLTIGGCRKYVCSVIVWNWKKEKMGVAQNVVKQRYSIRVKEVGTHQLYSRAFSGLMFAREPARCAVMYVYIIKVCVYVNMEVPRLLAITIDERAP